MVAWDNELNASAECHGPLMARGKSGGDRNGVLAFHHTQDPISGDVAPVMDTLVASYSRGMGNNKDTLFVLAGQNSNAGMGVDLAPTMGTQPSGQLWCAPAADVAPMIDTTMFGKHTGNHQSLTMYEAVAKNTGRPRRLTPKECERLMSWPDDHTRYGTKEDGSAYELSDTARYRLCGNGVGSVQVQWIAQRLADAITEVA